MCDEEAGPRKKGRPVIHDEELTKRILCEHRNQILRRNEFDQNSIVAKGEPIWKILATLIANETKNGKPTRSGLALYTYVSCNEKIRLMLDPDYKISRVEDSESSYSEDSENLLADETLNECIEYDFEFQVIRPAAEYLSVIEERSSKCTNNVIGVHDTRTRKRGIPDVWEDYILDICWDTRPHPHGYMFKNHDISEDFSGHFYGKCGCDSAFDCIITIENDLMTMKCTGTKGNPNKVCSVRQVRGPKRKAWSQKLIHRPPKVFQTDLAGEYMKEGDPWPAHIPSIGVLRTIRHEAIVKEYIDPDPLRALEILQATTMKNEITLINSIPFMVCYSTKAQQELYKKLCANGDVSLAIDSTGSINFPLVRPDGSRSGPIFLYHIVVRKSWLQISLAQMLSEQHTTRDILMWLNNWILTSQLPFPTEMVMDGAIALQCACIRAFTQYTSINAYTNSFLSSDIPPACWIRSDGAHFLKTYVDLLKDIPANVATFYKSGIGKLITCCNLEKAEVIIRALLTVSQSEYHGPNPDGSDSASDSQRRIMAGIFQGEEASVHHDFLEEDNETWDKNKANYPVDSDNESFPSLWEEWGNKINSSVNERIELAPGNECSPYYCQKFADKLLVDIKTLCLWSCVFVDRFGARRIPATSSQAENEFGQIKSSLLKNAPRIRVDRFCEVQKIYYDNQLKLINAALRKRIPVDESQNPRNECDSSRINDDRSQKSTTTNGHQCPICARGDMPDGAHKCDCGKAVHLHAKCSESIGGEEGYGQKRRCLSCVTRFENPPKNVQFRETLNPKDHQPRESTDEMVSMETEEHSASNHEDSADTTRNDKNIEMNRRNSAEVGIGENSLKKRGTKRKAGQSVGYHFRDKHPPNHFESRGPVANLPILKSGNEKTLQAIRKDGKKYNLECTDVFDAMFHLTLAAGFDSPDFFTNTVESLMGENHFLALIHDVKMKNRIHQGTYNERCRILSGIFDQMTSGHRELHCLIINCQTTPRNICDKLFINVPTLLETIHCEENCTPVQEYHVSISIPLEELENDECLEGIEGILSRNRPRTCETHQGTPVSPNVTVLQDFLLIEPEMVEGQTDIPLTRIPSILKVSSRSAEYKLRGIIHYQAPRVMLNDSAIRRTKYREIRGLVGRYIAYALRNKKWFMYDKKNQPCKWTAKVCPNLLLYSK